MEDRERDKRQLRRQFEEKEEEHYHLPLLVAQLPQGTAVLLQSKDISSRLDSAVKCCSSEVLVRMT